MIAPRKAAGCRRAARSAVVALLAVLVLAPGAAARLDPAVLAPNAFEAIARANHRSVVRIETTQYFSSELAQDMRRVVDSPSYLGTAGRSLLFVGLLPLRALWKGLGVMVHPAGMGSSQSIGSGFIVDPGGQVLTANHVIDGASQISVDVPEVGPFDAVVIGQDRDADVALLQISTATPIRFEAAKLGDSDNLEAGQFVMAMGNPLGLQQSVSAGVISAVGLLGAGYGQADLIQHDAGLNPGSSGGPLFDLEGRVVGINSSIAAGGRDIGFAIPIDTALYELNDLRAGLPHPHSYFGITFEPISVESQQRYGLASTDGVRVTEVADDSPAAAAGLQVGDVIVTLGQWRIAEGKDLFRAIGRAEPNHAQELEVLRDRRPRKLAVTPIARPDRKTFW